MAMSGYIEYKVAYGSSSINLSHTATEFHTLTAPSDTTETKYFGTMPSGAVRLSHLEIVLDNNHTAAEGAVLAIGANGPVIAYDANGTQICQGPAQGTNNIVLAPSIGSNGEEGCVLELNTVITFPPGSTPGNLYLMLAISSGSGDIQCVSARLHWHTLTTG